MSIFFLTRPRCLQTIQANFIGHEFAQNGQKKYDISM